MPNKMLNKITDFGGKLASLLGDRTKLGVEHETAKNEGLKEKENRREKGEGVFITPAMLSNFLHYEAFDQTTNIFLNKKSCGFILEAVPLIGASEETVNILTSILTDVLPQDVDLQFLLWGSNKAGDVLDRFEAERSGRGETGEIFEWLAKKRTDFLKKGINESLVPSGNFIIRNIRLFIVVSTSGSFSDTFSDTKSMKLMELRDSITSSLKSVNMLCSNVNAENFLRLMSDLVNPSTEIYPSKQKWNKYDSLSIQITDPEYKTTILPDSISFKNYFKNHFGNAKGDKSNKTNDKNCVRDEIKKNEGEAIEVRALTVKEWPNEAKLALMTDSIGQLFNSSLQIPCPFVISFSLRTLSAEKSIAKAQYKFMNLDRTARSSLGKFMPLIGKEHRDWDYVRTRLAEGDKLVKGFFQVLIFAPEKTAASAERKVRDLYMANGWKLKKEIYLQFQSWLAMLPMRMSEGMYDDLSLLGRLRTMTASNAVNLSPLQGEWKGSSTPSMLLPGRRGQLATWNPFDNTEGNFNIAIAAASGKGKSMFTQEYITCLVGSGAKVWVIDVGRSYEKTCRMLGGTFVEFLPEKHISLNPFTFIKDFESSLGMLKPLLTVMVRPNANASDEEISFLEKALKSAWDEKGNSASITTVSEWLGKQNNSICQNLSHLLYTYTRDGMYGRYFDGPSNIDLNSSFVVLELQELKSKKDLQKIILLVLMYQISEAMYLSDRSQIKSCVIDEAWDLLGGENDAAAKFIETGYRTARRYKANFVTITQSINDYFKNATSRAALENSDYNIILGQRAESIDQLKASGRFNLDSFGERLFKSLRKTDDYSECIIKDPSGMSAHRIIFDPYSRILFSSKGDEFEAVNNLVSSGKSLRDAIEIVARKFE